MTAFAAFAQFEASLRQDGVLSLHETVEVEQLLHCPPPYTTDVAAGKSAGGVQFGISVVAATANLKSRQAGLPDHGRLARPRLGQKSPHPASQLSGGGCS